MALGLLGGVDYMRSDSNFRTLLPARNVGSETAREKGEETAKGDWQRAPARRARRRVSLPQDRAQSRTTLQASVDPANHHGYEPLHGLSLRPCIFGHHLLLNPLHLAEILPRIRWHLWLALHRLRVSHQSINSTKKVFLLTIPQTRILRWRASLVAGERLDVPSTKGAQQWRRPSGVPCAYDDPLRRTASHRLAVVRMERARADILVDAGHWRGDPRSSHHHWLSRQ